MKMLLCDSSSLILLCKVHIFERLFAAFELGIAPTVYDELTRDGKHGAELFSRVLYTKIVFTESRKGLPAMGRGEREVISLYLDGRGNCILTDDKKAAIYCKRKKIPFVNSLLIPRLLHLGGVISKQKCCEYQNSLASIGYYSETILSQEKAISDTELRSFFRNCGMNTVFA